MGPGIWVQNGCCHIPLGKNPTTWVHKVGALWGGHYTWEKVSYSSATCIGCWLQNTLGHCLGWSGGRLCGHPMASGCYGSGKLKWYSL